MDQDNAVSQVCWQGQIQAMQCRAWVWRYKMDNRTHHHLGFNLWIHGEAGGEECRFTIAISDIQHRKLQFRIGDHVKGTAWPRVKGKHDIADYYRTGGLKILSRADQGGDSIGPPYTNLLPPIEVFCWRGARLLDEKLWRKECFTCMWANKSAVEIEYKFDVIKRYRKETFCYGPRSCPIYNMGKPRPVPYFDCHVPSMDSGWMDEVCTENRNDDD